MLAKRLQNITNCSRKVIVIAGTTGVGKSQLSIQLASAFNGEVINSDSMQMYKGLPIITNKHPIEERNSIAHHVMDHVAWDEEYHLHRFEQECLQAIDDIHSRGKVPIVVGGTHYYLQVLFHKKVAGQKRTVTPQEEGVLNSEDPLVVYNQLLKVDPVIAERYHPNDSRRVRRMLEIFYSTGIKPSDMFAEQKLEMRYDTLFLWIYSNPNELDKRLDARVDAMLMSGAMDEITGLYNYYKEHGFGLEQCENGVFQVIGFKEFLSWLENGKDEKLQQCAELMKLRTRQYAKRQIKWIRKMLLPDVNGEVYVLDASDLNAWDDNVSSRAFKIVTQFIKGAQISEEYVPKPLKTLLNVGPSVQNKDCTDSDSRKQFKCSICKDKHNQELIVIGIQTWKAHLASRRHRSNLARGKKKQEYETWLKEKTATT